MKLLSKIARKTGPVGVYITVVRHSHGQTRVIHSIWPPQLRCEIGYKQKSNVLFKSLR